MIKPDPVDYMNAFVWAVVCAMVYFMYDGVAAAQVAFAGVVLYVTVWATVGGGL